MNNEAIVQIKNLTKTYERGRLKALDNIHLEIRRGEFVAIQGPSGSGKSTLLNMIGALDKPDSGEVIIAGESLNQHRDLSRFRAHKVGFIFQLHNLLPSLTAHENVQIPMFELNLSRKQARDRAKKLLELVGLSERAEHLPTELSGGERQRVAVARALANEPEIILADEPTGNLDSKTEEKILKLFRSIHQQQGVTLILVTHDQKVADTADRVIKILDGRIIE